MSNLFAMPFFIAQDVNGYPYPGAKMAFYQTGTTTPQAVYQDEALGTPHTNPVVADAGGRFPYIFLTPGQKYKVVITDADDVQIYTTLDPVEAGTTLDELTITGNATIGGTLAVTGGITGYVPTSRTISAGTGLTGGGDLSANRSLAIEDNPTLPGTEGVVLPGGTTAQRPSTPTEGLLRPNTDTSRIEAYIGGAYVPLSVLPSWDGIIEEQQTSGTNAGTFTAGAWQKRLLNTEVYDPGNLFSISSNEVVFPAGTFLIDCLSPAHNVNAHKCRLYNVTDATSIAVGNNGYSSAGNTARSRVVAVVTFAASKTVRLEHYCGTTRPTDGFGVATSFGVTEVYATMLIRKLS